VRVFQGERELAADNKLLGQFDLVGIAPAPRGVPQIEVTFDIDANGIVNVTAKDKATGKEQKIRIQASGGLTEADIDRMVKEAEANAEADKKKRALVEARNQADAQIGTSQKALDEAKDKAPSADGAPVEKAIAELQTVMAGDSVDEIEAKTKALQIASVNFGAKVHESSNASSSGSAEASRATSGEDVVDADFEEVDDSRGGQRHG
jgi:molecular chaperone DnaK